MIFSALHEYPIFVLASLQNKYYLPLLVYESITIVIATSNLTKSWKIFGPDSKLTGTVSRF